MNPVRAISREVAGAWRSLRYDLRRKPSGSASLVPAPPGGRTRQRLVLAAAGLVLLALASGGILAMVTGMRALLDPGRPPAGLPAHAAPAPAVSTSPRPVRLSTSPIPGTTAASPAAVRSPSAKQHTKPAPKPPIPTPAPVPTCSCTQPPRPSPSSTPAQPPSPTPSAVSTPTPEPSQPDGVPGGTDPGTTP